MGLTNDAGDERERAMEKRIGALKRLVSVMDRCADTAEVYHECLDRGWDLVELRKEAGV